MRKTIEELKDMFGETIPTTVFELVQKTETELPDDALDETLFFLSSHWRDDRVPLLLAVATAQYIDSAKLTTADFDALPEPIKLQHHSFWTHVIVRMLVELDKLNEAKGLPN